MTNKDILFVNSLNEFKNSGYFENERKVLPDEELEVYKLAISFAYKDLQWRTMKDHTDTRKEENINKIANLYMQNVHKGDSHIHLIEEVEKVFYDDWGNIAPDQCFGKAQKVVNMGLKYLYCLSCKFISIDYENRDIPLDERIFDFYYLYRKYLGLKDSSKVKSWSNIQKQEYIEIEKNLKDCLKNIGFDMYPIEAEFIIWNYASAKLVINQYNKAVRNYHNLNNKKVLKECFDYIDSILIGKNS